jgi:hypothetical protein
MIAQLFGKLAAWTSLREAVDPCSLARRQRGKQQRL